MLKHKQNRCRHCNKIQAVIVAHVCAAVYIHITIISFVMSGLRLYEPRHEKNGLLPMQKHRCRPASQ